jgi:ABC-type multidrug transport system ATPase subunit
VIPFQTPSDTAAGPVPAVFVSGIIRHFGRFAALRGITAEFAPGRLYVVLGDNGAGKSTLLRIIAGLMPSTGGELRVLGSSDLGGVATQVGYMGHAPLLYDELDALENLRYFAGLYGIDDDGVCAAAIERVGLDPSLKRRLGQYSQGMRQRISLARAILHDPKLLLLDEPFSNVDVGSAREMSRLLGEMRDLGKTIFVVTHQASILAPVADETVLMSEGLIVAREPRMPDWMTLPHPAEHAAELQRRPQQEVRR